MWGMDEDNQKHALLSCCYNDNGVLLEKAGNFRALWSGVHEDNWDIEVGTQGSALTASMNALISCVKDTDDETFKATIGQYLDINSALDYYLYFWANAGLDSLENNMLLATYDGVKWICGAYDMDSVWGLYFNGSKFIATNFKCPEQYQGPYSLLWERITKLFVPELQARYAELRRTVLSYPNIVTHFERFMDVIGLDLYAEDLTIYTGIPSGSTNNIKQIRNYVRDRLAYVDAEVSAMEPPADPIPCTGITMSASELTFTEAGTKTLTATVEPENTTDSVVWTSNDNSVATVTNGVVTAKNNGNATITATCGSYSASCSVSVSGIENFITADLTAGIAINTSGTIVSYSGTYTSDFIEVESGNMYSAAIPDGSTAFDVWAYNESQTAIKEIAKNNLQYPLETFEFGVPADVKYIRICVYNSKAVDTVQLIKAVPDESIAYNTQMVKNYKLDKNGALMLAHGTLALTTYYPVEEGKTYTVTMGGNSPGVMLYDENLVSLGEVGTASGVTNTFTVPTGAKYARWMCANRPEHTIIATVTKA
jgi:hypothetical protein